MLSSVCHAWPSLQTSSSTAVLLQFEKYFSSTFVKSPVSYKKRHNGETLGPIHSLRQHHLLGKRGRRSNKCPGLDHDGTFRTSLEMALGTAQEKERARSLAPDSHPVLQQLDHS